MDFELGVEPLPILTVLDVASVDHLSPIDQRFQVTTNTRLCKKQFQKVSLLPEISLKAIFSSENTITMASATIINEIEAYLVSNITTKACNQIHPESATSETSSISLFSQAQEFMLITNTTIACRSQPASIVKSNRHQVN